MLEMKRFVLSLLTLTAACHAFSQKQYFIYLQADPEQAFFVKMNEKVHSSTASGYLILSRLKDSSYNFSVGFPENKWPEQKFNLDVKGKDHGYLLKNFSEKGWGLVDLQTMAIQMSLTNSGQKAEQRDVSVFTDILSKAANDPSLKEKPVATPVALKEEKKNEPTQASVKNDDAPTVKRDEQTVEKKDQPAVVKRDEPPVVPPVVKKDEAAAIKNEPAVSIQDSTPAKGEEMRTNPVDEYKRSVITKKSERSTSDGLGLTFVDDYGNGKKDTVRIFIPNPKSGVTEIKEPAK
jgi:hypothetical protein